MTYILDENGNPVPEGNMRVWAKWMETADRTIAFDDLPPYQISTVFLGLDHSAFGDQPILYETLVFYHTPGQDPQSLDQTMRRYGNLADALAGHKEAVRSVEDHFSTPVYELEVIE